MGVEMIYHRRNSNIILERRFHPLISTLLMPYSPPLFNFSTKKYLLWKKAINEIRRRCKIQKSNNQVRTVSFRHQRHHFLSVFAFYSPSTCSDCRLHLAFYNIHLFGLPPALSLLQYPPVWTTACTQPCTISTCLDCHLHLAFCNIHLFELLSALSLLQYSPVCTAVCKLYSVVERREIHL